VCNVTKHHSSTKYKLGELFSVCVTNENNSAGTGSIEDLTVNWIESAAHDWHRIFGFKRFF